VPKCDTGEIFLIFAEMIGGRGMLYLRDGAGMGIFTMDIFYPYGVKVWRIFFNQMGGAEQFM